MSDASELSVRPLAVTEWDDLVTLFGTKGDPSWCWCQFFMTTDNSSAESAERNRAALLGQMRVAGRPLGVLARLGDEPVGWLALGPRTTYPRLINNALLNKAVGDDMADQTVWATTCFVIKVGHRRRGTSAALLRAGIELARSQGASVVEGHPTDVSGRDKPMGSSSLYHGVATTFIREGFSEVARTTPTRPVMRLLLD